MTHEGRLKRGKENFNKGLLNNEDTKYFLENSKTPSVKPDEKSVANSDGEATKKKPKNEKKE